jgi:hypothetical protein
VNARDGLWCIDLLSQRGTVVNGRATRMALLRDGDLIEAGRASLVARTAPDAPQPLAHPVVAGAALSPLDLNSRTPGGAAAAALEPIRDMLEQFQQCFVTMARMFTTMQQEHTAMMCEQMRQVQEVLREVREARPAVPAPLPAAPPPSPPAPASVPKSSVVPKQATPEENKTLADAHAWFLDRLTQKSGHSKPT